MYYYDPPPARFAADDEDDPFEGDNEHRTVSNGSAGPEDDDSTAAQEEARICPECLSVAPAGGQRACTCESEHPVRPVRVHRGRGARCPVCRSRYGRYDVLTPVSLGNSRALTHVSRSLLRELPEGRRKLLVFCDSRQDASHQAQFIEGDERHLRIRRAIYTLLAREGDTHDMRWLVENLYHEYIDQGFLPRAYSRDAMRREMDRIEGGLLSEFVSAANVRAGLERLGLVRVTYAGLAAALNEENFRGFCEVNRLRFPNAQLAFERLLDFMRGRFAVTHDALRTRLVRGDRLSERYGIKPGRQIGLPVAFLQPGQRAQNTRTYKLTSTWSESGAMAGVQQLWIRHFGEQANADNLASALGWLADRHLIEWSGIGTSASEVEGYQVNWECLEAHQAASAARCVICGRIVAEGLPDAPCPRPGCEGRLVAWEGALAAQNVNALNVAAPGAEPLKPAEHSAAITDARRSEIEAGFQDDPPKVNVLVCTPTLELGVNIGDLEAVAMRNVPPSPANYAQRAGRTGRESRMGVIAGFARNTPHDGYFFDHPDEVIAGAIPAPRFNTANLQAIARHVRSLVVEEARLDFPADLQTLISEEGALIPGNVEEFIRQLRSGLEQALNRGEQVFGAQVRSLVADPRPWLAEVVRDVPQQVRDALEARAALVEAAVFRMRELGQQVRQTQRQQEAEQGYRYLARKLREDYRYAYLPRVLAESGVLPGYAFPGDPGSLSLGYDPQPVFAGRLQAQREFAPGQVVYFRGHRWRVGGAALNRPGASSRTSGADRFSYTECPACGLANRVSGANNCARCGAELSGPTMVAWDNGAFQAWPADVDPESEEERQFHAFDVRAHPQRDVTARTFVVGPWTLELRRQEEIWWINHGFLEAPAPGEPPRAVGFNLCSVCGELRPEPRPQAGVDSRRGRNRDRRADRDPHDERCGGTPERVALGHQDRADTLRLIVPGLQSQGTEGIAWAWSLAWAVVQGAVRLFDLNEDDIEPTVLTRTGERGQEALEIIWIDDVLGGSGILQELTARFPAVAAAASEHLRGHECPSSCYRCLRHYRNQRIHRLLSWRLVAPYLAVVAAETIRETVTAAPAVTQEGPDWEEARREGCGSPLELRLLRAIREAGLPEPDKQVSISSSAGRLLTVADFAYQDAQLLIYVDGLAFHSSLRMRIHDANQTNQVQAMGYRVLRFVGPQVYSRVDMCVDQIRNALAGFEQH